MNLPRFRNITEREYSALASPNVVNLADAHVRWAPSAAEAIVIAILGDAWRNAAETPYTSLERMAWSSYASLARQSILRQYDDGRCFTCYASSVATDLAAAILRDARYTTAFISHPTFDNIPDLFRRRGFRVHSHGEQEWAAGQHPEVGGRGATVWVIVTPNNPTGVTCNEEAIRQLAKAARENDACLVFDTSFRLFNGDALYDIYSVLEEEDPDWIVLEDTGKLFPSLDLKIGGLVVCQRFRDKARLIWSELILNVSPVSLAVVARFSTTHANDSGASLRTRVLNNRAIVTDIFKATDTPLQGESSMPVEMVSIGTHDADSFTELLADQYSVAVVPASSFFWDAPEHGRHRIRVALARDPDVLIAGTTRVLDALGHLA